MKITISTLLILSLYNLLLGQVPYNQEFQVNTTIDSDQLLPDVCNLLEGGFLVCWYSWHNGGGIYGQVFNSDGSKRGSEFQVNTTYVTGGALNSTVTDLADGGFVVCWESPFKDGDSWGVCGQVFNSDGSKRGSEFQVNTYTEDAQERPTVCSLTDSGFVVCWESFQQDGSVDGIYGQIFNSDGSKRGSEFQASTYSISKQANPKVSSLVNGGFVLCWDSWDQDGSKEGIYGQVFNNDGTKHRNEFQVNTYTNEEQVQPCVSGLYGSGFVISWQSAYQDGDSWGVYGQVFNSDGSKRSSEFQVNTYTLDKQTIPTVCSLVNNGFAVCWVSNGQDGSMEGIYGQIFNNDGTKHGSEFQVNDYTNSQQTLPKISGLEDGGFVVCWESRYQDGDGFGIYAKRLLEDATSISGSPSAKNKPTYELHQNYPNPFNPKTTVEFSLYREENVTLKIFNIAGQLVATLISDSLPSGNHKYIWNADSQSSGVYLCQLKTAGYVETKKMILLK